MNKDALKKLIKEVIEEKRQSSVLLAEATFGSVRDRVSAGSEKSERTAPEFVVMSSDRGERSPAENLAQYKQFKQAVKAAGYPFTEFIGSWEETDEESNEKRRVRENSVIIYGDDRPDVPEQQGDLFTLGQRLSQAYNQEAFIYGELVESPRSVEPIRLIQAFDADGNILKWGGPWSSMEAVKDDAPFWSKLRGGGSAFQFTEAQLNEEVVEVEAPNSYMEALKKASQHKGKKIKFVRGKK